MRDTTLYTLGWPQFLKTKEKEKVELNECGELHGK